MKIKQLEEELILQHLFSLQESYLTVDIRVKDLRKWLDIQKDLWIKLSKKHKVAINDAKTFIKFGEFFYNYVDKNKETPTLKKVIQNLDL